MSFILFWLSVAVAVYSYIIFPVLVVLRGVTAGKQQPGQGALHNASDSSNPNNKTPMVSIIVAAHNEVTVIGEKIESVLSLDYPRECLELVIASDGSDDGTNQVVSRYSRQDEGPAVRLLALPRVGKAAALNTAVETAEGEILVFTDANSIFAPHTLRALLAPFADPAVGGVAGNQVYTKGKARTASGGAGERVYWAFDRKLKIYESRAGNVISATGALYALRRELFQGIPDGVTDDFYNSTGVIAQGRRLVFAPEAVAYEEVASTGKKEFGRKVRVMTRGLTAVAARRELLDPRRSGWYAWQLLSHKVLRRLVSVPLLVLALVSPRLWHKGWIYKLATLGQSLVYGAAVCGALVEATGESSTQRLPLPRALRRLMSVSYYFVLVNVAALMAIVNLMRGRRIVRW